MEESMQKKFEIGWFFLKIKEPIVIAQPHEEETKFQILYPEHYHRVSLSLKMMLTRMNSFECNELISVFRKSIHATLYIRGVLILSKWLFSLSPAWIFLYTI